MDDHVPKVRGAVLGGSRRVQAPGTFYFHNCLYESVWRDNRRRHTQRIPTVDVLRTYGPDHKVIFVGDATMSPYEIVYPGGSVEHWNEEPGAVWMGRALARYAHAIWLNPEPVRRWETTPSIDILRKLMDGRMFPLTVEGIDRGVRALGR